mgnify:CR=1 FL=1
MNTKNIVLGLLALILIGGGIYFITQQSQDTVVVVSDEATTETENENGEMNDSDEIEEDMNEANEDRGPETVIGSSVGGTQITAFHFGDGEEEILLIGGVHGSDAPSTKAVAQGFVDYYMNNEDEIPENITLTVIPNLNPDGGERSGASGRFNTNNVDLNRNFDCEWSETAVWRNQEVSGGSRPFSEPEAQALRSYVEANNPSAAIVYFAAEGKVYPSACAGTPSNASVELAATYANAAGYPVEAEFDAYAITGDMVNWMAKQNIPAISVLLSSRDSAESNKNQAGLEAVLNAYAD